MEIIEAVPPRKHIDQSNAGRCFPSLNCILFVERKSKMSIRSKPISNETFEAIDLGELPSSIALRNSNAIIDTIAIEVLQMANAIERSFMQKCSDSVTLALCGITPAITECERWNPPSIRGYSSTFVHRFVRRPVGSGETLTIPVDVAQHSTTSLSSMQFPLIVDLKHRRSSTKLF